MKEQDIARFWTKVQKTDGCWLWTSALSPEGYGRFFLEGRNEKAYRVAYMLAYGPIPAGMFVCHTCDNRRCVNPSHLWLGTNADNNADMITKGRHARVAPHGERHGRSKLTEQDVLTIRQRAAEGAGMGELAREYGVNTSTISEIVNRIRWTHI